ncbi:MAG: putative sugar nucleotidyl transferase [Planctomycetota bacterium]
MELTLFDDGNGKLAPITDLRPAFGIRIGAFTTLERWTHAGHAVVGLRVPKRDAALATSRHGDLGVNDDAAGAVFVNGRWPLGAEHAEALAGLADGEGLAAGDDLLAVRVPESGRFVADIAAWRCAPLDAQLLDRPWHVRSLRDACLAHDLRALSPMGAATVHPSARIAPTAVLDAGGGPIYIAEGARVSHHAIIIGPAYVGPGSTVLEQARIRPGTAIGPACKVAGEVGGTIFQGFANKAHDGYLGDSFVGEWVNLGAGTTNSNLLNTYGEIVVDRQRTGETFLGCTLGDHVKTAICTRIMTGAIVGTGTMWATGRPIAGRIEAMRWATDAGEKPYRIERFLEVARAAMARRDREPSEAEIDRLRSLADRGVP